MTIPAYCLQSKGMKLMRRLSAGGLFMITKKHKGFGMKSIRNTVILAGLVSILVACSSNPEKEKNRAEAKLTDEKTKTMQEYKSCIKKAKQDEAKLDVCERILKAVE